MQEINREIADKYGLDIKGVVPVRDYIVISTGNSRKVFRKTDLQPDRIHFVHDIKEHLYLNGFNTLDRFVCTLDGKPYIETSEGCFVITESVEGRECNFDLRSDTSKAATALALMHKAVKGFTCSEAAKARDELGKLPGYFNRRLDEIKKLKKAAKKGRSQFDYLFLEYVDYFYDAGAKAISALDVSCYDRLVEEAREQGMICHHDYTHNNIIICDRNTWIINYEFACHELKVYDIANLLRRKMRKCNWDIKEAHFIIDEYSRIESISEEEFEIMCTMLQFPQKFWRVANKYYNSRRCWSEKSYVSKLQEVIDELNPHTAFMKSFWH